MKKLRIWKIIGEGIKIGAKNYFRFILNLILWLLTIWIPYLNVGTTIGLFSGIPLKIGREGKFNLTEIFNPVYRKKIGDWIITITIIGASTLTGFLFLLIPGIVLIYSWFLAPMLIINEEITPLEALRKSNEKTYGNKWRIFWIFLFIALILYLPAGLFLYFVGYKLCITMIGGNLGYILLALISLLIYAFPSIISSATQGIIYKSLVYNYDQ